MSFLNISIVLGHLLLGFRTHLYFIFLCIKLDTLYLDADENNSFVFNQSKLLIIYCFEYFYPKYETGGESAEILLKIIIV